MQDGLNRGWIQQHQHFLGNYNDYTVQAVQYTSPSGEIAWHTTSWGAHDPVHDFWVSGKKLFRLGVHPMESIENRQPIEVLDEANNVAASERKAILMAIEDWESPNPRNTDWRDLDPEDPTTFPDVGADIQVQYGNGQIVNTQFFGTGFIGITLPPNSLIPEISEHDAAQKKRWRLRDKDQEQ
jgi:hypothetical protein